MKFTKMQGCGNDYVYVDGFSQQIENRSELAIRVSDRHFGIGSDGLIFINPSKIADCEMEMYNSDGSRAEMCGNGVRCVAKFAYDHKLVSKKELTVETLAGIKQITLRTDASGKEVIGAKVNMGSPILTPAQVPCNLSAFDKQLDSETEVVLNAPITITPPNGETRTFQVSAISMGNPHAVIFIEEDPMNFPLEQYGPVMEVHPAFPRHVNTEFVQRIDRHTLSMRVWERGAGETFACGTGACAVAAAAILNGYTEKEVCIHLRGGDLHISWSGVPGEPLFMEGPATNVFEGEYEE